MSTPQTPPQVPTGITSAPPAPPLSAEEKNKRYAAYRKATASSRYEVKGKPGLHYFWAAKEDSAEMTRLDIIGYVVVREPDAAEVLAGKKKPLIQASGLREDGTYTIGDVILTSCLEEIYEFALLDIDERHNEMRNAAKENFKTEAEKAGVPVFEFSK